MPKGFTAKEKEMINNRLIDTALECLKTYGMKKTTVDEIVKRVSIPKGTFYLFYESKELLFFKALMKIHDSINKEIYQNIIEIKNNINIENVTELIYNFAFMSLESGLASIFSSNEMEMLMIKLPEEVLAHHFEEDTDMVEELFKIIPTAKKQDAKTVSTALRNLVVLLVNDKSINKEAYKLTIRGIVMQLFEE